MFVCPDEHGPLIRPEWDPETALLPHESAALGWRLPRGDVTGRVVEPDDPGLGARADLEECVPTRPAPAGDR